jgi:hypothetical protein
MKRSHTFGLLLGAFATATVAWGGHEMPIYPSFYPHEIAIETLAPEQAASALRDAKIQAYIGREPPFAAALPDAITAIETLGSFVMVRINSQSPLAKDEQSVCAAVRSAVRQVATGDVVLHPYPVTPFHGDYLYHVDLAEAAKARVAGAADDPPLRGLKIRASGAVAQSHPDWAAAEDWDAEVFDVDAGDLAASSTHVMNGWFSPPWVKAGWFHAEHLLADAVSDPALRARAQSDFQRLTAGDFSDLTERVNLERDLVQSLTAGCRTMVAGYTVKREYFNADYSAGVENVGYDSITGLNSPMFIRTVKLKDFPWNGWLAIGINAAPATAWNPIGGMSDPFGRLMWSTTGDFALLPSPYDTGWMLSRIADLPTNFGR